MLLWEMISKRELHDLNNSLPSLGFVVSTTTAAGPSSVVASCYFFLMEEVGYLSSLFL